VLVGGILIAVGHLTLAVRGEATFFAGLLLVILGTALLKPCASSLVGQLYPEGGARRDAGFTLFYMGVNVGAFLGPLVCGYLAERWSWHWGFGAAGVGMVAGVIQYSLTSHHLGEAGARPSHPSSTPRRHWSIVAGSIAAVVLITALVMGGHLPLDPVWLAQFTSLALGLMAVLWFAWTFAFAGLNPEEKRRLGVLALLFLASAVFWSGFEQAGSSMNLFAERFTDRSWGRDGMEIPTGWFQSVNPVYVLLFAPAFSWIWVALAQRGFFPSVAAKFASGLVLLAVGFVVLHFAAQLALEQGRVLPVWLLGTYLLLTWGELALSPVGLSFVTKLAPARLSTQTMGMWFLSVAMGNLLAGLLAGEASGQGTPEAMPRVFLQVALTAAGTAVVLVVLARPLRRWTAGIS
jgi:POT family proton-dependent oligopeptide transporter